jgi:hypothetical protein
VDVGRDIPGVDLMPPVIYEHEVEHDAESQVEAEAAPPAPRQSYPVSSYYEAARQQAWQQPASRTEMHVLEHSAPLTVHEESGEPIPARTSEARVVSEPQEHVYRPVIVEHLPAAAETHTAPEPELKAVKASVFDDDFFRRPKEELAAAADASRTSNHWPEAKVPSFAGYAPEAPAAESDELDIPAFLRRNH